MPSKKDTPAGANGSPVSKISALSWGTRDGRAEDAAGGDAYGLTNEFAFLARRLGEATGHISIVA
jgi:hypothetical protein